MSTPTFATFPKGGVGPCVAATAALNGVGFTSHQTWAFSRAEAVAFAETPFRCANATRATMASVKTLDPRCTGTQRIVALATQALGELLPAVRALGPQARVALVVGLSERFSEHGEKRFRSERARILKSLQGFLAEEHLDVAIHLEPRGHASFAHVAMEASEALASNTFDAVIAGGVDTYYDALVVEELIRAGRLFDGKNMASFIPGEGAAFALLMNQRGARHVGLPNLGSIVAGAVAQEPAPMLGDRTSSGQGLTWALRGVTSVLKKEGRRLDWILGDVTNEPYRSLELQLSLPRALAPGGLDTAGASYQEVASDDLRTEFLPLRFGDLGAATMPTALVLATQAFARGASKARNCMLVGSSTNEDRGAVLVAKNESVPR